MLSLQKRVHGSRRQTPGPVALVVVCLALIALLTAGLVTPATADDSKSFHWGRYDYDVQILPNSDMLFTVVMSLVPDSGSFHQGYYEFSMARVMDVRDVQVWEGDRQYSLVSAGNPYTYEYSVGSMFTVNWWFPYTSTGERTFTLKYRVVGGLRIYPAGDQFYWDFYAGDRPGTINSGTITVHLPAAVPADQLRLAADPGTVAIQQTDPSTVQATVTDYPAQTKVTLRVQFPHGLVSAEPPAWQAADDAKQERLQRWGPIVGLGSLGGSLLLLFGGLAGVIALWYVRGRDKPVGVVAEYITEPPSDLPPGLAGTLVDEKVDVRDILATIVDLARRGALSMEEVEDKGLLGIFGGSKDFIYRLQDPSVAKLPFEKLLLASLFEGQSERRLSQLRNKFYSAIPKISAAMYDEITKRGFFYANPEKTRKTWLGLSIAGLVVSVCGLMGLASLLSEYSGYAICLPLSAGVVFVALAIVSGGMARRTEAGALENAKWRAFKRYLESIDRYTNLQEKADLFERYLPYAIAFNLQRDFINKFSRVQAPAPMWYQPYPPVILGGPGYYGPGTGQATVRPASLAGPSQAGAGAGTPSLQGMSNSLAGSLQGMSDGLISMLNSASHTLTSRPSSSGSSGSGGWSGGGGGFSGGGGGGGGSGFR